MIRQGEREREDETFTWFLSLSPQENRQPLLFPSSGSFDIKQLTSNFHVNKQIRGLLFQEETQERKRKEILLLQSVISLPLLWTLSRDTVNHNSTPVLMKYLNKPTNLHLLCRYPSARVVSRESFSCRRSK